MIKVNESFTEKKLDPHATNEIEKHQPQPKIMILYVKQEMQQHPSLWSVTMS